MTVESAQRWRDNNREKHREYQRQYREKNPNHSAEWFAKNPNYQRERILQRHGLSLEQFDAMLSEQNDRCAICCTDTPGGRHNQWQIDHCHRTGTVRGLLCFRCNVVLSEHLERHWLAFETYLEERGT